MEKYHKYQQPLLFNFIKFNNFRLCLIHFVDYTIRRGIEGQYVYVIIIGRQCCGFAFMIWESAYKLNGELDRKT